MIRAASAVMIATGLALGFAWVAWCEGASVESDVDIGRETAHQTLKTRVEFADKCGLTPHQLAQVMRAKGRLGFVQHQLAQQTEALAVTLGSTAVTDEDKQAAVERYLALRAQALAQYEAVQQEIITAVGADSNPLAMGALIVLGAVDSGRRITCAVRSPVAGGAGTDVHGEPRDHGLLGSFGPMRPGRPAGRFPRGPAPGAAFGPRQ